MSNENFASQVKPEFSVRIVVCDHYLTKPTPGIDVIYSDFRGSDIKQVPVLRIFGSAPDGQKVCLHIHGVFPYFYIPCPTPNPEPQFLYQIAASLDKALNIALKQATSANQHVYTISLVKGLPFYGFHDKEHLYLKLFLYNPGLVKQAVELCSNGAILGQTFQPHESHLNFTLQFFIDFNLFGMSNIDLQMVTFRKTGLTQNSNEPGSLEDFNLKPESVCYYEADCAASHIMNRQRIGRGDGIENPGLEEVWNQEKERRKQLNVSMASKSLSQVRINDETESHYRYEQILMMKLLNEIEKPVEIKKIDEVHYPAESVEGSQLFKAVDVSMHLPGNTGVSLYESVRSDLNKTLTEIIDKTIVDESVALNCSISAHYSQVLLDNEDLELVDMLQDMDEEIIEKDSIMSTQASMEKETGSDSDDAEYSQVFNEQTILMEPYNSKDDVEEESPMWNDSFWEGASIPQLDGTCDDDHVKKVRKRKMRPFKLGLSRPKSEKKEIFNKSSEVITNSQLDTSDIDEINASRETIDSISELHFKRNIKREPLSVLDDLPCNGVNDKMVGQTKNASIMDLVNKLSIKQDCSFAKSYDLKNNFEPVAGPSTLVGNIETSKTNADNLNDSLWDTITDDNTLGIMSFYDKSKLFDISLEDNYKDQDHEIKSKENESELDMSIAQKNEIVSSTKSPLDFRETLVESNKNIKASRTIILTPEIRPPSKSYIESTLKDHKLPRVRNMEPYYSDYRDAGDKVEIGQMMLKLQSKSVRDLKPFERVLDTTTIEEWRQLLFLRTHEMDELPNKPEELLAMSATDEICIMEPLEKPPSYSEVLEWLENSNKSTKSMQKSQEKADTCKIMDDLDNPQAIGLNEDEINSNISLEADDKDKENVNKSLQLTMKTDGSFLCFGNGDSQKETSVESSPVEVDFLTIMLLEVHTSVRGDLHPDPAIDQIQAIFLTVTNDCPPNHVLEKSLTEIIVVDDMTPPKLLDRCGINFPIKYVNSESEILDKVIESVKAHDPDLMCGYEIEMNSWGYVLERSQILGLEIVKEVSRITNKNRQKRRRSEENDFEGRIIGRIMFNVWRLFRYELALSSYSFENCMYEILKERVPNYSYAQLSEWWNDESRILRWIPVEYYLTKLSGTVRMLEKLDIINRTSELARLFGLQWWEVLSRGSQFRVESLMLRAARPLNLIAMSPTVRQRAAMKAPECLPLIFEPESRYYSDPVIVLDFQSLYPSMMIAYNYCFSTCIGRVQNINSEASYEFGAWRLRIPKCKLETLVKSGLVHWSPVGVGFVKPSVRRGVLPALLRRILAARQAVKKGMKLQSDENVKKAMHSRQLGLKLIANVTYGYTAANFSGRMPCVEVGDSVVAKGRETLERAVKLVRDSSRWNVKVVYGDTDSMFVLVPGESRARAFEIGQEIADAVTADNPSPVALKLEKVYQPCILQTKKRYVGYMYESAEQERPVYEAKGIETVRRDGCPAGVKLLQRCLCELFDHGDMSAVKRVVMTSLSRLANSCEPRELLFTREYHGPGGYRPGAKAPPNEIAKRIASRDKRAVPLAGWRVSWVVCAGAPGAALVRLARTPQEVARERSAPHVHYYAARVLLPPLHRCLSLLGVDVFKWWREVSYSRESQLPAARGGIARYMWRARCALCGARAQRAVCSQCGGGGGRAAAAAALLPRLTAAHRSLINCQRICDSCCGHARSESCDNVECPVLWRRLTARRHLVDTTDIVAHLPSPHTQDTRLDF